MQEKPIFEIVRFEPILNPRFRPWIDAVNRFNGFDPTCIYERIKIDTRKRVQGYQFYEMFPLDHGHLCACGCEKELVGRRTRWAEESCGIFAGNCYRIICSGSTQTVGNILSTIGMKVCSACGSSDRIEIDHIVGVHHGGGGSWLNNFTPLCHACHVDKTNRDFKRGKYAEKIIEPKEEDSNQLKINF